MKTQTTGSIVDTLYPDHFPALLHYARYLCGDADQAEELTSDTLVQALEHIHTFRGGSLRAWLRTILRNRFRDDCRRPRPLSLDALDGDVLPAHAPGPEPQVLGWLLTQDALSICRDPDLFQAVALDGESLTNLARQTGENLNTLTARFRRDRARLRAHLTLP